jgi:anti-sigma factor RsiW
MKMRGILKMKNDPFKDDSIVNYLLGDLPEQDQCEIEDRAFQDPQYLQQILTVENDLIDEYVRGELSVSSRQKFEERFLASAERQKKVAFAKALVGVLPEIAVIEKPARQPLDNRQPGFWEALTAFFLGLRPAAHFALAAAAFLFFAGSFWTVSETLRLRRQVAQLATDRQTHKQERQTLEEQLTDERARNQDLASRIEAEQKQREQNEALIHELERQNEAAENKPIQPSVASLVLFPGNIRAGSKRANLVVPPTAHLVRLQLGLEPGDEYQHYRVELHTQDGSAVWSRNDLSARPARGGPTIVVTLPAKVFNTGQYELAIKGINNGKSDDIAFYTFDVQKR